MKGEEAQAMNLFEGATRIAPVAGLAIGFYVVKIIDWIVWGFVGVPIGKDSKA